MSTSTRLDIDLVFSLAESVKTSAALSGITASGSEQMTGTVTASGLDIKVYSNKPELFMQSATMGLKDLRSVAETLAEQGLTVSFSGPDGVIVRLGAVRASLAQRIVTGTPHIELGSRKVWAPLLRERNAAKAETPAIRLPPPTLLPFAPTFERRIRRQVTTTHYAFGGGRPRLFFVVGSDDWSGKMPEQFDLLPDVTTIGSAPSADLQLPGLLPRHAEIRHESNDEYVLHSFGEVAGGSRQLSGEQAGVRVLRTGARMEMGQWNLGFFREEYADHGRPYGGRQGGELAYQKPQPPRPGQN